jgi:acetyltransferase-like isoleucine patch superfamily enzyme
MKKVIIEMLKKSKFALVMVAYFYSFFNKNKFYVSKKNTIQYKGAFLKNNIFKIIGSNNSIIINNENRLNNCILFIHGNNCQIVIDEHCILTNLELWIEDDGGNIQIGFRTTAEGGHFAVTEGKKIEIGKDCMFSNKIDIRVGDSHAIFDIETGKRINEGRDVLIGNHVWIGSDSKILKGAKLNDGCIIGSGSIVTGNVEKDSIYTGIPAKKVKENIRWTRERK